MNLKNLCFVDLETTGSSPYADRIIEIGILRVEDNNLVKTYQKLVNPETTVSPYIENMTGIKSKDLEGAPTFYNIKDEVQDLLKDAIFIAHNVRFDYGFLKSEFKRVGLPFSPKHFCTVRLSRTLYPRRRHHNLDSIIEKFGFECANRHRAFDDAQVLWNFYQRVHEEHGPEKVLNAIKAISKKPSLPTRLKTTLTEKLPQSPGVYIFYGSNETPLYVGKSINIKKRILSHFSADHTSAKQMKMCQQIERIETIKTPGEISALIKESGLIKSMQPLYNRVLRKTHELVIAKEKFSKDGYPEVSLERVGKISPEESDKILGVFKSLKQAKSHLQNIAKEHSLCQKLLGLEKTPSSCFSHRLGWCKGACAKKEDALRYTLRFKDAFFATKIKQWPFQGAVIVEDQSPTSPEKTSYLVNNWCLLKIIDSNENSSDKSQELSPHFDLDVYRILVRFILNPKNQRHIKSNLNKNNTYQLVQDSLSLV